MKRSLSLVAVFVFVAFCVGAGTSWAVPVMPSHNYYSSGVQRGAVAYNDSCGCYTPISVDTRGRIITSPSSYTTEGCDVLMSEQVGISTFAISSPWTSGLYDQKTLFITKSNPGSATDSVYILGSYDPTVAGAYEFIPNTGTASGLAFLVNTSVPTRGGNRVTIPLPANVYLPYLRVMFKNNLAAVDTVTCYICGKSSYGN